jgi:hypothetical protein
MLHAPDSEINDYRVTPDPSERAIVKLEHSRYSIMRTEPTFYGVREIWDFL